jgi:hypothetical protein
MGPAPWIEEWPVALASLDLALVDDLEWERLGELPDAKDIA